LKMAGYDVSSLSQAEFHITPLPGLLLGLTAQHTIWVDQNAQGYGWYTDVSTASTAAFARGTGVHEVQAAPGSPAYGRVDLLTVVTHELGHVLGFASVDQGTLDHDWMTATLGTGVRRYAEAPTVFAVPQSPRGEIAASGGALPAFAVAALPPSGPDSQANVIARPQGAESAGVKTRASLRALSAVFSGLAGITMPSSVPAALLQER